MNRGQTSVATLLGITLISGVLGSTATWVTNYVFSGPSTASALETRVTTLETKQNIQEKSNVNQGNKTDYLVQAVFKMSNKLGVDVGNPPINQ